MAFSAPDNNRPDDENKKKKLYTSHIARWLCQQGILPILGISQPFQQHVCADCFLGGQLLSPRSDTEELELLALMLLLQRPIIMLNHRNQHDYECLYPRHIAVFRFLQKVNRLVSPIFIMWNQDEKSYIEFCWNGIEGVALLNDLITQPTAGSDQLLVKLFSSGRMIHQLLQQYGLNTAFPPPNLPATAATSRPDSPFDAIAAEAAEPAVPAPGGQIYHQTQRTSASNTTYHCDVAAVPPQMAVKIFLGNNLILTGQTVHTELPRPCLYDLS